MAPSEEHAGRTILSTPLKAQLLRIPSANRTSHTVCRAFRRAGASLHSKKSCPGLYAKTPSDVASFPGLVAEIGLRMD